MRLVLTGRHVEITPALRRLVSEKLGKLDRVLQEGVVSVQVVLTMEKYRRLVEMTLHARGDHMLRAVGDSTAWETSLSLAIERLTQQAHKVKSKWQERKRRRSPLKELTAQPREPVALEEPRGPAVVRATRYSVKSMTVEEAALAVDEENGAFLVFRNVTSDSINVVYRRKDGRLGLIEPEA
jgi:putative sigma-54 modulation protein